jgi:superfamily II DNA/RNA helicase
MTFLELGLSPEVLRAVEEAGYAEPTPIQQKSIPAVLQGRDVLGCAQTGTGKTGAFSLPMIDILASSRARARMPRALILEPTRELADQVQDAFGVYSRYHKLTTALLIGGVSMDVQSRKLERGPDVLIATPGRLLDHVERGQVVLRGIQILVIDETDRMLDMGFVPDVQKIVRLLPAKRQTLFFSATLSPEIRTIGAEFVSDPKEISVSPPSSASTLVTQLMLPTTPRGKVNALYKLIETQKVDNAIIFSNRKRDVDTLARELKSRGLSAAAIHGDLAQAVRMDTLDRFKKGEIKFLVASDVAARGLDIQALPFVINYDVPIHAEDYVHRIGRTARAGLLGTAYTLSVPDDSKFLDAIYSLIGKQIPVIDLDAKNTIPNTLPPKSAGDELNGDAEAPNSEEASPAPKITSRSRSRSRSRGRGSRSSAPSTEATDVVPTKAEAESKAKTDAASNTAPEAANAEPEHSDKKPAQSRTRSRGGRRRSRSAKQDSDQGSQQEPKKDSGGAMGGHIPAFLRQPSDS